ncbi:MAG: hypothetical protein R2800_01785 [Flavipsychrobacter sp.]
MKRLITILSTAILAWAASWLIAWWMIAAIPCLVAFATKQKVGVGFLYGFVSIALLWLFLIYYADMGNDGILARRMSILILGTESNSMFIAVNVLLGGIIGALGGWSGASLRKLFND